MCIRDRFYELNADASQLKIGPANELATRDWFILSRAGGLDFGNMVESSDSSLKMKARTRTTEMPYEVTLEVAKAAPYGITAIHVRPLPQEQAPGAKKPSDAALKRDLDAYLKRLEKAGLFSGAVLVARGGQPVYREAFGLASRAWNAPNRPDTKFNLGSMNKMVTAVAIAQLVQQGKLAYTDAVGKVLPDYPNASVREKVTIHHLLSHTSGLADYFTEDFFNASRTRYRTVDDSLLLFQDKPLEFEPGERHRYSNAGFMLLGKIVEKVSGQDYFEYVREHIYRPAGMVNTDAYEMDQDTPNLAIGYTQMQPDGPHPGDVRNNTFQHVIRGGPAGGGYSTVDDLLAFSQALLGHRLLDAKNTDLLFRNKLKPDEGRTNGYGFIPETINGSRIAGHGGGFPGISSNLDMFLDNGYAVVVLSNVDMGAQAVLRRTREMLTRPE